MNYQEFLRFYDSENPKPDRGWLNNVGAKVAFGSIIFALTVVASSRTYLTLYEINIREGMNAFFASIVSLAGVYGIEGFLIMYGLFRKRSVSDEKKIEKGHLIGMAIALAIAVIISSTSGFLLSALGLESLIPDVIIQNSNILLSVLIGIGISAMVYLVSEFVGWTFHQDRLQYDKHLIIWKRERNKAWKTIQTYDSPAQKTDWRNLSDDQKKRILEMPISEIVKKYGVSERTAHNWKKYTEK